MKKALIALLSAVMLLSITACSRSEGNGDGKEELVTEPLADIMDAILEGTDGEIAVDNADISQDRFSWFFGVDAIEGAEGYSSEAMIGSIAHSVALLRVPDGTDAVKLAGEIKNSVDPRKWICVEAEKTIVKQYANIILVVMSFEGNADTIADNFDAYFSK